MARKKAAVAAIFVLLVTAAGLIVLRSLQSTYVTIVAYTDDAGGLSEGTAVRLNGIGIGDLDKLTLTNSRDPKRKIEFTMKVNRRILRDIPDDSLVGEASTNLLGNYFIDIIQGRSPHPVEPGGELKTTVAVDPNKLMGQMASEFQQIESIFDRANKLIQDVQSGQGNAGMWGKEGMAKMNRVSREFGRLSASIRNAHGNVSKIDDLNAQMDTTQKRLDDLTAAFQAGQGTAGKLQAFTGELSQMSQEVSQLNADLNSPQGPSARMTKVQEGIDRLTSSLQSTLDHINAGQGTLGQLTVNPQLSQALAHTGAEFQALASGIRANPRKFLSVSVKLF